EHRAQPVESRAETFRVAGCVLSRPVRWTLVSGAFHSLPQLRAECMDPFAGVCRRRFERAGWHRLDGEGNLWTADNCLVGGQSTIYHGLGGGVSKIAPNGRPISPMTFGYRGGGVDCPGFGIAVAADDKVWADSLDGKTISVFDRLT